MNTLSKTYLKARSRYLISWKYLGAYAPKIGKGSLKDSGFLEVKEDTLWRHTFLIGLMYIRKSHTQFWFRSQGTKKVTSRIIAKPLKTKGKFLEVLG